MPSAASLVDVTPVLHNSGPGPIAVFRTGAVGIERRLVYAPVGHALGLHGMSRATQATRVAAIKADLVSRGLLVPFRGIVRLDVRSGSEAAAERTEVPEALPWLPGTTAADALGWILMAFTHVTPPMLLFTRPPGLSACTDAHTLTLRWFGPEPRS